MKRELKFRGWDDAEKKLYYPKDLFELDGFWYEDTREGILQGCLIVDSYGSRRYFNLSQYTGLKDKNGREIYDGDIVQYNYRSSYDFINFEVKWSYESLGWILQSKSGDVLVNQLTPAGYRFEFIEVVGNIFENPELIK